MTATDRRFRVNPPAREAVRDVRNLVSPTGPVGPAGPQGPAGPPGSSVGSTYIHNQSTPATTWTITHNLGKYPSIVVVDSGGTVVQGGANYVSVNLLVITFSAAFSGRAFLN